MEVWKAYAGDTKIGGKPVTYEMVLKSFQKSRIKACELQGIFHYLKELKCDTDCTECLKRYLKSEVRPKEEKFNEVVDEFGEIQLKLF